jgi:hypothetical protein
VNARDVHARETIRVIHDLHDLARNGETHDDSSSSYWMIMAGVGTLVRAAAIAA